VYARKDLGKGMIRLDSPKISSMSVLSRHVAKVRSAGAM